MPPSKTSKTEVSVEKPSVTPDEENMPKTEDQPEPEIESAELNLDNVFSALKTLLSTVEKLQKSRQEVGDIKSLIIRMLDGELLSGEELDLLKSGVSGLSKLVRIYSDYQVALEKAQPARNILDTVLKS